MRLLRSVCWLLIAGVFSPLTKATAQDLKVLVLDALNGKPQASVEVKYFCVGPPINSAPRAATTNDEGLAKISNFCNEEQRVEILVFPPNNKEQCGGDSGMSFNDVLSRGFVSKPDSAGGIWCPTKVSKTLKPVPGEVILFVKKPTWWQSHVAG